MDRPKMPSRWAEFREWLLVDLTDPERLYVRRWILQWMNRWGQIPFASSFLHSRKVRRDEAASPTPVEEKAPRH